jgi:hypothetical protein
LTIGHLKSLALDPTLPLNIFQNFGNVLEGSQDATQNIGIFSYQSNVAVRNSVFSNIGFYNPMNTAQNSNAVGIRARSNTTEIK